MGKKDGNDKTANDLRLSAEKRLKTDGDVASFMAGRDPVALVHELQVHKIELEMQNEELCRAREKAEDQLSLYRNLYENLYDFAPVGYLTLDENLRIQGANLSGARLLGRERASLVNIPLASIVPRGAWEDFESLCKPLFSGETEARGELRIVGAGGEKRDILFKGAVVTAESGRSTLLLALTDITDRKRIEQALLTAHEELERRVEERTREVRQKERLLIHQNRQAAMGELLENIAHQWRQPLNAAGLIIQTISHMQQSGNLTHDEMISMEEKALEILTHMSRTIDDFRNYFRPDKEKVPFSVSGAVNRTIHIIRDTFKSRMIEVEINADEEPVVIGYPNEFAQVILNLLVNAGDALERRDSSGRRVIISIRGKNGMSVVTVSDNGGGIPAEIIENIFDPYFTTKGPDKGTGVGLYMSKTIIEKNMGGRLSVRNIGEGAEFRIEV